MSIASCTTASEPRRALPGAPAGPLGLLGRTPTPSARGLASASQRPCPSSSLYHIGRTEATPEHEKKTFQTFGKEVCLTDLLMSPVPSAVHREPICSEYQSRFGGHLPVPRAEAALPYWVPLSLRPRKQIQKKVWVDIPKATKACPCSGHRFGGRLPVPRDQAVMPYWVPRVLRSYKKIQKMAQVDIPKATKACPCLGRHFGGRLPVPRDQAVMPYWVPRVLRSYKKVVKRQRNFKGIKETPLDSRSWHNRWRICCNRHLLLKWLQLQALHQDRQLAPERTGSQTSFLPLCLCLLAFLQALLRAITVIRNGKISSAIFGVFEVGIFT